MRMTELFDSLVLAAASGEEPDAAAEENDREERAEEKENDGKPDEPDNAAAVFLPEPESSRFKFSS